MDNNYHFDGDTIDLLNEQREVINNYYKGIGSIREFIDACKQIVGLSNGTLENINSIGIAIHEMVVDDMFNEILLQDSNKPDKKLALEINSVASILGYPQNENIGGKSTIFYWGKLNQLVNS